MTISTRSKKTNDKIENKKYVPRLFGTPSLFIKNKLKETPI